MPASLDVSLDILLTFVSFVQNQFRTVGRFTKIYIAALLIVCIVAEENIDDSIVMVKQGQLKGSKQNLLDGSIYFSFKGIPYAQPPLGDLRFQAPSPPSPWKGIRKATEHGPICPQFDLNTNQILDGNEDCLFLNVYTRTTNINAKLPVMVYIYGGGFMSGSGNQAFYGPEFLLQHNVVMVTMNYRLEVLGFLSLDTPEVPGNAGMKDQVLALRWVKENIAKFGGDPDNVTIFGESAGSVAVTYHVLSPMSKGLFHKAIAQSGVCIDDSGIATDSKERAFRVGKILGKETTDTQELLRFLRSLPASKLTNMTYITETADEKLRGVPMRFGPVVENKFRDIERFLSELPLNAVVSKKVNKVPLIIGYNSAEGLIMLADQLKKAERLNANSSYLVPRELLQKVTKHKVIELGQKIMKFYTGDSGMNNQTSQGIVDMRTDMHFAYNIHRFANLYSSEAAVFLYRFDFATDLNVVKNFLGLSAMPGASHADDLFYLFYNELNKEIYASQQTLQASVYELTKLWANFAKYGNPTPEGSSVVWPRYSSSGREYLVLDEVMTSSCRADQARMEFWNKLYYEAGLP